MFYSAPVSRGCRVFDVGNAGVPQTSRGKRQRNVNFTAPGECTTNPNLSRGQI